MVQGGDPTGTGKGGTSIYGQKLYVYPSLPTVQITPFTFIPAKTRSTQSYDSPALESLRWPTRDLTLTVRRVLHSSIVQLGLARRVP
jgi:hypothetical protein